MNLEEKNHGDFGKADETPKCIINIDEKYLTEYSKRDTANFENSPNVRSHSHNCEVKKMALNNITEASVSQERSKNTNKKRSYNKNSNTAQQYPQNLPQTVNYKHDSNFENEVSNNNYPSCITDRGVTSFGSYYERMEANCDNDQILGQDFSNLKKNTNPNILFCKGISQVNFNQQHSSQEITVKNSYLQPRNNNPKVLYKGYSNDD